MIEKFQGSFLKEDHGCSIMVNSTIQLITDPAALGVYCYLLSKPNTWIPNIRELMNHFCMSKDKAYRIINHLLDIGVLSRNQKNEGGRYSIYEYILHLRPRPENQDTVPRPDLPRPENQETYKTKSLQNKDKLINTSDSKDESGYQETLYPMPPEATKQLSLIAIVSENLFNIPPQMISDWVHARKSRKKPVTQTVWNRLNCELKKIKDQGRDPVDAFELMVMQGWDSVNANWKSQQKPKSNYSVLDHDDQSWRFPKDGDLL